MRSRTSLQTAAAIVAGGAFVVAIWLQTLLSVRSLATAIVSEPLWHALVQPIGLIQGEAAEVAILPLFGVTLVTSLITWLGGGILIASLSRQPLRRILTDWSSAWLWTIPLCLWTGMALVAADSLTSIVIGTLSFWPAVALAGGLSTGLSLCCGWRLDRPSASVLSMTDEKHPFSPIQGAQAGTTWERFIGPGGLSSVPIVTWLAMALYVATFFTLTVMLWNALQIPHGDSAMYEEHLWNLLHGKGFRSYLDNNRLFLGEHVQVVHVLLVPVYYFLPHHLLLEFFQSAALAAGAIPVFWITQRHTGSRTAGILASIGYLLYVPMQFLDIAIDFKTFRPNAFEIPFLLFGLDALERGRLRHFFVWVALTLCCQEDAAPILAPLGVWIALQPKSLPPPFSSRQRWLVGLGMAAFSTLYLILVIKVVLPWFRSGGDVHFASYFSDLGGSTTEILQNLVRDPGRFFGKLWRMDTLVFGLALIVPLGGLPLLSPGRLAVAAPLFGILCLSDLTNDPRHHFHAPLVPIVVWAAAAGLGHVVPLWNRVILWWSRRRDGRDPFPFALKYRLKPTHKTLRTRGITPDQRTPGSLGAAAGWIACCALSLGLFLGMSPLSLGFWDSGSRISWRIYLPDVRAEKFPAAFALVPVTSRVASTDFVHPRFTHFERSYDYSDYRPVIPADTDFIVIDTRHHYSRIHRPEQLKEYRDHPGDWEVLMAGEFIVLRKRKPNG